jgi:hypothetical protein
VLLLAGLQISDQGRVGWVALPLLEGKGEPFLTTADGQQLAVASAIPVQGYTCCCEGPVESPAMAFPFGLSQGAIHIP